MKTDENKLSDLVSKTIPTKKESKRTTFKLNKQSLNAIDWITETYDIPAKEVFDIIESSESFKNHVIEIAKDDDAENNLPRERKTFVISKRTLNHLNKISQTEKIQRDVLVEKMVLIYKVLLEKHLKDEERKHEMAKEIINKLLKQNSQAYDRLREILNNDDPILERWSFVVHTIEYLRDSIEKEIDSGIPIDPNDLY